MTMMPSSTMWFPMRHVPPTVWHHLPRPGSDKPFMASMGIYVFSTDLLSELLAAPGDDFGNDIIPEAMLNHRVMGHVFDDYWADIGTIRRFYEVSLELATTRPFELNNPSQPVNPMLAFCLRLNSRERNSLRFCWQKDAISVMLRLATRWLVSEASLVRMWLSATPL